MQCLKSVGLGYLTLGQSTSTLSGGEAQRLKLAASWSRKSAARGALFIFDEPTTGLHLQDIHTLIGVLDGLVARATRCWWLEHHTDFIAHADWGDRPGPEGGDKAESSSSPAPPSNVANCERLPHRRRTETPARNLTDRHDLSHHCTRSLKGRTHALSSRPRRGAAEGSRCKADARVESGIVLPVRWTPTTGRPNAQYGPLYAPALLAAGNRTCTGLDAGTLTQIGR